MDKNKGYCPICNKELSFETNSGQYKYNCNCYSNKKFNYILLWCEECKKFTQRRGVVKNRCNRCAVIIQHKTMKDQDPEGYAKRQSNASQKANEIMKKEGKGVWSKEQHILAEQTKLKNGTSLANKDFRNKIGCNGGLWAKDLTEEEKQKFYKKLLSNGFSRPFSFKHENDKLYYYDKSLKDYVPWESYREKFGRKRVTKNESIFLEKLKSMEIFQPKNMGPVGSYDLNDTMQFVSTFRTQGSESWSGARSAFEQYLVDQDISWFAYIKFYFDKNGVSRPLVVGKTGSLLVNINGTDISFSMDESDGPARRFLMDGNHHWDKERILVIKAKSEKQALYYEYIIAKIFDLFES